MVIETKQRADETIYALTAENVMDRNCLIIPQQMLVREAARLLHGKRSHVAVVVDDELGSAWARCGQPMYSAGSRPDCPNVAVGRRPGLSISSSRSPAQRR